MSVDVLQKNIRKIKNPAVLQLEALPEVIPPSLIAEGETPVKMLQKYYEMLLEKLREQLCAVRFGFGSFAMLGAEGMTVLQNLLKKAASLKYYVLMDMPELLSLESAKRYAVLSQNFACDGVILQAYLGSDVIRPFCDLCRNDKSVFVLVRSANRSAPELQDLLTGSRLVHTAAADIINRLGEAVPGKGSFYQLGAVAAASGADSLRTLRGKYPHLFLLVEGYDYPGANAKNCSYAFDKLGHGAAVCAGREIVAAWEKEENMDPLEAAVKSAERMKKNLLRYISIL